MEFKFISLIALFLSLSLVSGRKYMECDKQTDPQMRCVCAVRENTVLISSDCGANREIAKDAVNYACRHNNFCTKGFVEKKRDCPDAKKGLCRYDCQVSIFLYVMDNYEDNYYDNTFGVKPIPSILNNEYHVISNGMKGEGHECASWRKEE